MDLSVLESQANLILETSRTCKEKTTTKTTKAAQSRSLIVRAPLDLLCMLLSTLVSFGRIQLTCLF